MNPSDFNKVTQTPVGLGMGKKEYETFAAQVLNRHIDANQSFDEPFEYKYNHDEMVDHGWLLKHGTKKYSLTKKSLGLLWAMFGK